MSSQLYFMQLSNVHLSPKYNLIAKIIYILSFKSIDFRIHKQIYSLRSSLSLLIADRFDYTVVNGPFTGMKISPSLSWGSASLAGKILGTYESGVISVLHSLMKDRPQINFINLGAADGYFSVAAARYSNVDLSYAFELLSASHSSILQNAKLNNVASKIILKGAATTQSILSLPPEHLQNSLILCDIEGAEYSLFTDEVISFLSKSYLIIELHDKCSSRSDSLIERLRSTYSCSFINQDDFAHSVSQITDFTDFERALINMEGRHYEGVWCVCVPF